MELKLENGRYVPAANGDFARVTGTHELAQRITMKLAARRGAYLPLPEYGSRIYTLLTVPPAQRESRLRSFVYEALGDEPDVTLTRTELTVSGDTLGILLYFTCGKAGFTAQLRLEEENI